MTELTGIAWDHPRGFAGLCAVNARLEAETGIGVRWETHSLAEFSATSIGAVAERYDLVVYDHPFVGDVHAGGVMIDLQRFLPPERIAGFRDDAVGHGIDLFTWEGGLWGLPIDAAVQIAAFRPDLCARAGLDATSLAAAPLDTIIDQLAQNDLRPAISFGSVGSIMVFFSLCNQLGAPPFSRPGQVVPRSIGEAALSIMHTIADAAPVDVLDWESIGCLEAMARRDDLAYCPCIFGFSAYSMDAYGSADGRHPLVFVEGPSLADGIAPRGIIGGAGIGVSARCAVPEQAALYAARLMDGDIQLAMGMALGQPGRRSTWRDPALNQASGDFYANTLSVMDQGYIRPRWPGWVPRQDAAGHCLEAHLRKRSDARTVLADLDTILLPDG